MLNHQPDDRVVDRDRDRVICVDGRNVHVVENGPPSAPALLLITVLRARRSGGIRWFRSWRSIIT